MGAIPAEASPIGFVPAPAAATKTVTLSHDTDLIDGQYVRVSWSGFPKKSPSAVPFHAFCASTPVRSAPTVPPRPCAATTSSESSRRVRAR